MSSDIKNLDDYSKLLKQFTETVKAGLNAAEKAISDSDRALYSKAEVDLEHGTLVFKYGYYNVKLQLLANVDEDVGYLRWYYLYFDEENQAIKGKLIIEHYFDYRGDIFRKRARDPTRYGLSSGFGTYLKTFLLDFCKQVEGIIAGSSEILKSELS